MSVVVKYDSPAATPNVLKLKHNTRTPKYNIFLGDRVFLCVESSGGATMLVDAVVALNAITVGLGIMF